MTGLIFSLYLLIKAAPQNLCFCLAVTLWATLFAAHAGIPVLVYYNDTKQTVYNQLTSSVAPTLDAVNPYVYEGDLWRGGATVSATITNPSLATNTLTQHPVFDIKTYQAGFTSIANLNAVYADGTYNYTIDQGTGPATANLTLSGSFATETPTLTTAGLTNGVFAFDPTVNNTLTWNSFTSGVNPDDTVVVEINGVRTFLSASATSYTIFAGTLTQNTYNLLSVEFWKVSTFDNTSILTGGGGPVEGRAAYSVVTQFAVQALPEPNTVLLLAGAAGLLVICQRGKRS